MSTIIKTMTAVCRRSVSAAKVMTLTVPLVLTGCGSLTGLDASSSFSCPMTPGSACRSLSDTYDDAVHGRTPDQLARVRAAEEAESLAQAELQKASAGQPAEEPALKNPAALQEQSVKPTSRVRIPDGHAPQRLPEIIVTIWMAPWTDDEGDFHEGERIHARAFDSRWAAARRRADNTHGRKAVVQLPFARRPPVAAESPRAAARESAAGEGAAKLIRARAEAEAGEIR